MGRADGEWGMDAKGGYARGRERDERRELWTKLCGWARNKRFKHDDHTTRWHTGVIQHTILDGNKNTFD